jgi:hypothetical protein
LVVTDKLFFGAVICRALNYPVYRSIRGARISQLVAILILRSPIYFGSISASVFLRHALLSLSESRISRSMTFESCPANAVLGNFAFSCLGLTWPTSYRCLPRLRRLVFLWRFNFFDKLTLHILLTTVL